LTPKSLSIPKMDAFSLSLGQSIDEAYMVESVNWIGIAKIKLVVPIQFVVSKCQFLSVNSGIDSIRNCTPDFLFFIWNTNSQILLA